MSAIPYGQLSYAFNANGGVDVYAGPFKIFSVSSAGAVTFNTAVIDALTEAITGALTVTGVLTASGGIANPIKGSADPVQLFNQAGKGISIAATTGAATFDSFISAPSVLETGMAAQSIAGDGAITVPTAAQGMSVVTLSKGSAAAITLVDAVAADIGKVIVVRSSTAFAHVITAATSGFNGKGSSGTATLLTPFTNMALMLLAVAAGNWTAIAGGSVTASSYGWNIQ